MCSIAFRWTALTCFKQTFRSTTCVIVGINPRGRCTERVEKPVSKAIILPNNTDRMVLLSYNNRSRLMRQVAAVLSTCTTLRQVEKHSQFLCASVAGIVDKETKSYGQYQIRKYCRMNLAAVYNGQC